METEWNDGREQQPGQWLIADLGQVREVAGVTHALGEYARDFPRLLAIDLSLDGSDLGAGLGGPDRRRRRSWRRRTRRLRPKCASRLSRARLATCACASSTRRFICGAWLNYRRMGQSAAASRQPAAIRWSIISGDDLRAVGRRACPRRGRGRHAIERRAPAARKQVVVIDEAAPQVFRHRVHEHVVLHEVAARGVEHRGVVGDALGDDAVARLGRHDVDRRRRDLRSAARCRRGETR